MPTRHSYIDQGKLDSFNGAVSGVTDNIRQNCGAYNCLNATLVRMVIIHTMVPNLLCTQVSPSKRNTAAGGNNCAAPTPDVNYVCQHAPLWNSTHPTYCGANMLGECDDGTCYQVVRRTHVNKRCHPL